METPLTADFVYIRLHGHKGDYASDYNCGELSRDTGRIRGYLEGVRDVLIYFNNYAMGFATKNSSKLAGMLG